MALPSPQEERRERLERYWTAGLFALAIALRLLLLGDEDLWYDEAVSVDQAGQPTFGGVLAATAADNYPPLHNLLMHVWMGLFGASPVSVRLPSVFFSLIALWLANRILRRLFGARPALIATALLAVGPTQIQYAQEMRMYALFLFLTLWSTWCLVRWLEAPTTRRLVGYGVVSAFLCYSHLYAGFFLIGQNATVLILWWRARRQASSGPFAAPSLWRWAQVQLAVFAAFSAWLPTMLARYGKLDGNFWIPTPSLYGLYEPLLYTWRLAVPLCVVLLGLALFPLPRRPRWLAGLFAPTPRGTLDPLAATLVLFLPLAASLGLAFILSYVMEPLFLHRYLFAAMTAATMLVAVGIARVQRTLFQVGLVVCIVTLCVPASVLYYRDDQKARWSLVAAEVEAHRTPNDLVVLWPHFHRVCYVHNAHGPLPSFLAQTDDDFKLSADERDEIAAGARSASGLWLVVRDAKEEGGMTLHTMFAATRPLLSESQYTGVTTFHFGPPRKP